MFNFKMGKRGVLLIMVLATILVVTTLAAVVFNIILNQGAITQHQVTRTQAYYAAMAGINYAIEKLRVNDADWQSAGTFTHKLCRSGCTDAGDINDLDMPVSLKRVEITVGAPLASGPQIGTRPISAKAYYTSPTY